jgi:hypothetical protein
MTSKAEERILGLMRETGQPLVVSGVKVSKWRVRSPPWDAETQRYVGRLQVGVTPTLREDPSAYRAEVAGHRVAMRAAAALIRKRCVQPQRHWRVRGRFRLGAAQ